MHRNHLLFDDPAAATAWGFIQQLSPACQHLLLARLREHLAVLETTGGPAATREAHAVRALHEALDLLLAEEPGSVLTVEAYRRLRHANPDAGWPEDRNLRRWLGGGSWNDALRRARMEAVPDGDRLVVERARDITAEQAVAALRLCAGDLGGPPTLSQYVAWARRDERYVDPDIPASQLPFMRLFESWAGALVAAGLVEAPDGQDAGLAAVVASGHVRPAQYAYSATDRCKPLQRCAAELGRSPRQQEYTAWRQRCQRDAMTAGRPVPAIPSPSTLVRDAGTWDEALAAAGLERLGGRATRSNPDRSPRGGSDKRWSQYSLITILDRADAAVPGRLSTTAYGRWRREVLGAAKPGSQDRALPIYQTYISWFGSWQAALDTLERYRAAPDEPFLDGDPRLTEEPS
ncbi:homing endonuclease associated repeat-containing protein [Paraconexibacter algicola]|uniref:Uncharacterized protein n=1 Tax=Paraconexibacter algicola TaxID=2133960 RepID=A0A2T4UEB4_9ACTN|nr:hypothetical protein [Paraconexibacter algicola]PTL56130.1 hypothetical protein C7Y72_14140 [Paraconexibacter algicola]